MLFTFLFLVFFSIYMWLYYKPNRTSRQHHPYESIEVVTLPSQTTPATGAVEAVASVPTAKIKSNADDPIVQIVDKRTLIPGQSSSIIAEKELTVRTQSPVNQDTSLKPEIVETVEGLCEEHSQAKEDALIQTSELELDADTELEPAVTEEEAISLAVETTLAKDTGMEVSTGEIEDSVPELMRPKPPDPELVEAAVRDAEEKLEDFLPPEIGDNESQLRAELKIKNGKEMESS